MRWPWQSREVANQIERRRVDVEERLRDLQAKYDALLKSHLAYLTPTTTTANGAVPSALPREPRPKSAIAAAIKQEAQGDGRLAAYLHKRARELKAEHPMMSDEGIALLLSTWESTEVPPSEES